MDLVEQHADYDPMVEYGFTPKELSPEEQHLLSGESLTAVEDGDNGLILQEDVW